NGYPFLLLTSPVITLSFADALTEGSNAELDIVAPAQSADENITLTVASGTADPSEIIGLPANIILPAGQTSLQVPFSIAQNAFATSDPETVTISATASFGKGDVTANIKEFVSAPFAFTQTGAGFKYNSITDEMDGSGQVNVGLIAGEGEALA